MADAFASNPAGFGAAPTIAIEKIYVKDLSLENPGSPQSFKLESSPQVEVGLRTNTQALEANVFEAVLTLTVTARLDDKTIFLVEASQAGIFTMTGFGQEQLGMAIATHLPGVLFPYARELVADSIGRMGYPQIHLQPINFEALYAQQAGQQGAPAAQVGAPA
ncbi:MAG: protein-export chaperone SecB [Proteobacteria bacterium]|nr:protein-export chaperone SecB [Pseudomonadota bacterium]